MLGDIVEVHAEDVEEMLAFVDDGLIEAAFEPVACEVVALSTEVSVAVIVDVDEPPFCCSREEAELSEIAAMLVEDSVAGGWDCDAELLVPFDHIRELE